MVEDSDKLVIGLSNYGNYDADSAFPDFKLSVVRSLLKDLGRLPATDGDASDTDTASRALSSNEAVGPATECPSMSTPRAAPCAALSTRSMAPAISRKGAALALILVVA